MRRSPLTAFAGLLAIAALGAWLALSSAESKPSSQATGDRGMDRSAKDAAAGQRSGRYVARKERAWSGTRPGSEAPRSQLAADHTPASGPVLATVRIPAIGVRAPVIKLGLNPDRTLQVPANSWQTGLWAGGVFPGQRGPAVIVGHVDSRVGPAVFFRLDELAPGDEVRVTQPSGETARFVVVAKERAPKTAFPTRRVYAATSKPTLRLVTCTGDFDEARGRYPDNLIVFARRA